MGQQMPRITAPLTDAKLRNLKPKERPYEVSDGGRPGLKVEVQPSGAKIWRFRYVLNGRREKLTIGEMGLAAARKRYDEARELVAQGTSPALEKQREKARNADKEATVDGFFRNRFVPDHLARLRSHDRVVRLFELHILPKIGRFPLDRIVVEDLERILDGIKAEGHEASAVLVRAWLSSFFELAVDRRRITTNPVKQIKRKRVGQPAARDRVMTAPELRLYLTALRTPIPSVSEKHRLALELILLTACRRGEAVLAQWPDVDLSAGVWTIPPENQKAGIEHRVFLSDRAREVLESLKTIGAGSPWVLAADRDLTDHVHPETLNGSRGRLVRNTPALKALPAFTTHDGRRAFSTWAHEMLEHPDVVESCLGHTIKGVRGIYARPQFEAARRRLMQSWADYLHALTVDNVVPIKSNTAA